VTRAWPSAARRRLIGPDDPAAAAAISIARRVAERPNATTSIGNGKRPSKVTHLLSSAIITTRMDAAAMIFS